MRLPNGYGSVYKLKGNRTRPWIARIPTKSVLDIEARKSTQQYYTIGYFAERDDAMEALIDYNKKGVHFNRLDITLVDLYKEWLARQEQYVGDSSLEGYRTAWKHFLPLHDEMVKDIKKSHIQAIVDDMRDEYSKSAISKTKMLMSLLMDYAMADDIIDKNYAKLVRLPRKAESKKESFTDAELKTLFEHSDNEWVQVVLILVYTGMRIGELLDLTKFSIDIKQWTITGGLKTDAGRNRTVPIHPKIQPFMQRLYDASSGVLVESPGRTLKLKVDNFRRKYYYPALETAGISKKGHSPHACRYTFALLLEKAGVSELQTQKLIGHADYATTANTYTHPDIPMLREAINKMA